MHVTRGVLKHRDGEPTSTNPLHLLSSLRNTTIAYVGALINFYMTHSSSAYKWSNTGLAKALNLIHVSLWVLCS